VRQELELKTRLAIAPEDRIPTAYCQPVYLSISLSVSLSVLHSLALSFFEFCLCHLGPAYLRLCGIFKWRFFALTDVRASGMVKGGGRAPGGPTKRSLIFNYFARRSPSLGMLQLQISSSFYYGQKSQMAKRAKLGLGNQEAGPFVTSILKHLITILLRACQDLELDLDLELELKRDVDVVDVTTSICT